MVSMGELAKATMKPSPATKQLQMAGPGIVGMGMISPVPLALSLPCLKSG